ncbi:ATP12-domain-containing protein [Rhizoclosmatium globosum]|uniref:ATP12-domain-containing protein n=1 Tax=Rhizoclosmatium globosum TaxID=329046 RepID=A0A1Y2BT38_9FUNG|nr:ATP12-domain-containing protein [Rhizoclosmatium globosum]|eukprot:ORY37901.1 ATP12-domain-containing protein [Rhizoclosmatium globosum]
MIRTLTRTASRCYTTAAATATPAAAAKPLVISRFWKKAFPEESSDGIRIKLDGRTLKNPEGVEIVVPRENKILASLVAAEWEEQERLLKSSSLPMTSIAVRGIELGKAPETRKGVIETMFRYLDTDSILYMQDGPQNLVDLQEKYWRPIINWAAAEFQVPITPTFEIFSAFIESLTPMQLAAFERAVLSSKSFLIGTAILKRGVTVDFATDAARVEVNFQVQKWGEVLDAHDVDYQALKRDLGSVTCCLLD